MQANDIRTLIEKVEAGKVPAWPMWEAALGLLWAAAFSAVVDQNESVAFALMREVLGDRWRVLLIQQVDGSDNWSIRLLHKKTMRGDRAFVTHKFLPTAILLATLSARLFELENDDAD
jgi:hypothetical protein